MEKQNERSSRVCFIINRLGAAGTERQLLALIKGLNRDIVRPFLCLLDGTDEESRALEPLDCSTIRLGIRSLHRPAVLGAAWKFVRFLWKNKIDIVQTHFPDSTYFAVPLARLGGVKHVIRTRRDLGYWLRPIDRLLGSLYNPLTTAILANCYACREAVVSQERAKPDRVLVLPNGIDLMPFDSWRSLKPRSQESSRCIGMVANLRPVKAPDVFVRAAALVIKRYPNTIFRIAGNGDAESVWRLAERLGVLDHMRLLGTVIDLPRFLADLDVAVLTSHSEGLSNSLLEYMAAAKPIVATNVGGNAELITPGVHGLLVPPGKPELLAESICTLLENSKDANLMGMNARRRVSEKYSLPAMLRNHERFYQSLVLGNNFILDRDNQN